MRITSRHRLWPAGRVGALAVLMIWTAGCQAQLTREHRELLRDGEGQYAARRYSVAVTVLDRFLEKAPRQAPEWSRGLYVRGMANVQAGNRPAAYKDLRQCVATSKDRELIWKAYVTLGTMYFEDENWDQALVNLRAAASRMPAAPPKDAVLFRLGQTLERQGRMGDAQQMYAQLRQEFPRSAYRPDAARKVDRVAGTSPRPGDARPVAAVPTAAGPVSSGAYAVQAGVFANPTNAQRRVEELRRVNLDAYVRDDPAHRTARHVVLVGRYATRADAERQLANVRRYVKDAVLWP